MYLFDVTRLTDDSCISISSATIFRVRGAQVSHAMNQKCVLLLDDFASHLENCLCPLIETLRQPVC